MGKEGMMCEGGGISDRVTQERKEEGKEEKGSCAGYVAEGNSSTGPCTGRRVESARWR